MTTPSCRGQLCSSIQKYPEDSRAVWGWVWSRVKVGVGVQSTRINCSSFTYTPARAWAGDKDWGLGFSTSKEKSGKAGSRQDVRMVRQA